MLVEDAFAGTALVLLIFSKMPRSSQCFFSSRTWLSRVRHPNGIRAVYHPRENTLPISTRNNRRIAS